MKSNFIKISLISGLLIIPIVLLVLPADYFDSGESICISKFLLDLECYGCGITRAIQHLIHLDINVAMSFNKLAIVVLPLLIYQWAAALISLFKKPITSE